MYVRFRENHECLLFMMVLGEVARLHIQSDLIQDIPNLNVANINKLDVEKRRRIEKIQEMVDKILAKS